MSSSTRALQVSKRRLVTGPGICLTNTDTIETPHGQDAFAGAGDERLVSVVDIVGRNIRLATRDAEFLGQFDHHLP
mgnify:CR=1 FL=1